MASETIMSYRHDDHDDVTKEVRHLLGDYAFEYDVPGLEQEFRRTINRMLLEKFEYEIRLEKNYFVIDTTFFKVEKQADVIIRAVIDDAIDRAIEWIDTYRIAERYHNHSRFTL